MTKNCVILYFMCASVIRVWTYFNLLSIIDKNKKQIFGFLKDRLMNIEHSWANKYVSKAEMRFWLSL